MVTKFFRKSPVKIAGHSHESLMLSVSGLYSSCCDQHVKLSTDIPGENNELMKKVTAMILRVWKSRGLPKNGVDVSVVKEYAGRLWTGIVEGYGLDFPAIDFDTPDYRMLESLQQNVWQFSAAKNHQELIAINNQLLDANGNVRSFADFRDAAQRISIDHVRHLETEYNTAIGGAQMASEWVDIESTIDDLPLLMFEAVMDGNTTDLCRSLDGVIRPVNDPFWNLYYPLNHYGCRSRVRRLASGQITPTDQIIYPTDLPKIFKVNLGKQGLAFPSDHPYFYGLPNDFIETVNRIIPKQ